LPVRALLGREQVRVDVLDRHLLAREGWDYSGEGLRRPRLLARHVALRNGPLFDGPQGLSAHAIEYIEKALLGGLRDGVDLLSFVANRDELRCGDRIIVPKIVMHELEMPEPLSGSCVESEQAAREEIAAETVG